jgi:hypothetical protein
MAKKLAGEPVEDVPAVAQARSRDPEFIRLPKPGTRCPYTGLSRTGLAELAIPCKGNDNRPPVRNGAVEIRKHGAARGVWLIRYRRLIDYLDGLEARRRAA